MPVQDRNAENAIATQRPGRARLEVCALGAILALAALVRLWHLSQNGYGREYYAAGVRSMMASWHNFFFNAFDPAGFISIDKPPLALWLQVASAKIFGFSGLSVLLPQAILGVLAVGALYRLMHSTYGIRAAIPSALVLALTPAAVAVDRSNNTESLLISVMLGATWLGIRAAEAGRPVLYFAAMTLVGIGFNVKMGAALLLAPVLAVTYWRASSQLPFSRHLMQQSAAAAGLVVVALAWAVAFDLTPSSDRPYAGSTRHNSMLELALVHNGLSRFTSIVPANLPESSVTDSVRPSPVLTDRSPTGVLRLLRPLAATQIAWLLPLGLVGIASAWSMARRIGSKRLTVAGSIWTGWLVGYWAILSFAGGPVHTYYVAVLGPPVAAFAGLGFAEFLARWRDGGLPRAALALIVVVSALWQIYIVAGSGPLSSTTWPVRIGLTALAISLVGVCSILLSSSQPTLARHWAPAVLSLGPLLVMPSVAVASLVFVRPNVATPVADIRVLNSTTREVSPRDFRSDYSRLSRERLLAFLAENRGGTVYLVAVPNAIVASPLILATGQPVMAMGGYLGDDPALTTMRLAQLRDEGKLRYVLLGGFTLAPEKQKAALDAIARWVRENGQPVDAKHWDIPRRRTSSPTYTVPYGNGALTLERQELYDLVAR